MTELEFTQDLLRKVNQKFDELGIADHNTRGHFAPLGRLNLFIERTGKRLQNYGHFLATPLVVVSQVQEPGQTELKKFLVNKTIQDNDNGEICCFSNDFRYFILNWSEEL
jgi:hypothetical protein